MHDHQGDYGIDGSFHRISARGQVIGIGAQSAGLAVWAVTSWARGKRATAALAGASAAGLVVSTVWYGYATRAGKFVVWERVLRDLRLAGDETVLDLAIHNVAGHAGRRRALDEAVRVLRLGGRLAIADLWETRQHAARLRELGWANVRRRNLGWRMWYGGPWFSTRLVTATKPG